MRILAIDPANENSAFCLLDENYNLILFDKIPNERMRELLRTENYDILAIEKIESFGMAVGATVFETCVWIGRFIEIAVGRNIGWKGIYRKEEKLNLCKSTKAKDANIRQALIDRFAKFDFKNGKGTKKQQDFFYGVSADMWAAIAVGVTYLDNFYI